MTFRTFDLKPELLEAVTDLGFETPTPIQSKTIPEMLGRNRDILALARTGTGKTAAYGLPLLHQLDLTLPRAQALVLCPTRELCLQIRSDLTAYARHLRGARVAAVYGGAGIQGQIKEIRSGAQVIVATPGRLLDLLNRKAADLSGIACAVLDEADEMVGMGFKEDIDAILARTPPEKRTSLFSATMPEAAWEIAETYMTDPLEITTGDRNDSAEQLRHLCYMVKEKDRYPALRRLIDYTPDMFALIFCRTREETRQVSEKLMQDGYNAEALHGDLSQPQRDTIMRKFRSRTLQLLVATDVAARGIDVERISHVIHYKLPDEPERYTHRSGRTARAGRSGISLVIVNTREVRRLDHLTRLTGIRFEMERIPQGSAICEKQIGALVRKVKDTDGEAEKVQAFLPAACAALDDLSREELIQRFIAIECDRLLTHYQESADLNVKPRKASKPAGADRSARLPSADTRRVFINVGRLDKLREGAIVRLVCDRSGISARQLGVIDLKREFSFFQVEKAVAWHVVKSLKGARLDGRKVVARFADSGADRQGQPGKAVARWNTRTPDRPSPASAKRKPRRAPAQTARRGTVMQEP